MLELTTLGTAGVHIGSSNCAFVLIDLCLGLVIFPRHVAQNQYI